MQKFYFLLLLISGFAFRAQNSCKPSGVTNMYERLKQKYDLNFHGQGTQAISVPDNESEIHSASKSVATHSVQWKTIGSSMNISGVLMSEAKPLQYNKLGAVSFVHRKGSAGTTAPYSNEGSIIARITTNWGASWDSTCIWASDPSLNNAQTPQGGIYNPIGNNFINSAFFVGMGPSTGTVNGNYIGNWYASKQLGAPNYNYTASAVPGAMQFISNKPPFAPNLAKHDFSMHSFTSTDDGVVRSVAGRYAGEDVNGKPEGFIGAAIIKGTFNAGVFQWTSDTIIPATITSTLNNNNLWEHPLMAWSEYADVGYMIFIGAPASQSLSNNANKGWQPIVYKTSNGGNSWAPINNIDFTTPPMYTVLKHLDPVRTNSNLVIPFFNVNEGIAATVDAKNQLHMVSTILSTASSHNDSLAFTWQYHAPYNYSWSHTPGKRPYIYDFIGDGNGPWQCIELDSMSTESPGEIPASPGYSANLWSGDPGNNNRKPPVDSRLQASRTADGQYLFFSWAESDTAFTSGQEKWNSMPNIKVRSLQVNTGSDVILKSPTEVNLTRASPPVVPGYTNNPNIKDKAFFHFMAPTCQYLYWLGNCKTFFRIPFSVSNNSSFSHLAESRHWLTMADLEIDCYVPIVNLEQNHFEETSVSIYPNPAKDKLILKYDKSLVKVNEVSIHNALGQEVFTLNKSEEYENLDIGFLPAGVYFISVSTETSRKTFKVVKE